MFDIKLVAYKPFGDRIGELPQPLSIEVGDPLSDLPSMRLKYSRDAIGAELLDKDIEVAMEVYDPNTRRWSEPPNGRFLRVRVEGDTLDPIDGIQYMFPGYSWLLTRMRIYPLSAAFVKGQVQDATATEKAARAALDTAEDNVLRALGMKLDTRVEFEKGYPDSQKSVWIDTSDLKKPVVKTYVKNEWKTANAASQTAAVNAVNKWVEHQQTQGQLANMQDRSRLTKRSFTGRHAGSVFAELLGEAKQRGRLSGLTYKFTTTHDSAGKPWPTQTGVVQVNTGTDLGALLTTFVEGGQLDFRTQGRELQVYAQDTVMMRAPAENLILRYGLQIDEAPDRSTLENLAGEVLFMGDDGLMFTRSNPEAMAPWGVWESSTSQSGIKTEAAGQVYAKTALAEAANRRVERTRGLQFHEDVLAPLPYVHYLPGDYVFAPGANGKSERQRVQQITLTKDGRKGGVQGNIVLNDRFLEAEIRNSRRVQAITNGSSIGGTGSVPDREQYVDLRTPNAPRYVRGTGEGEYIKNLGFKAFISAEWFWDGNATNGTSMEDGLSKYEVQYRLVNSGTLGDTSNAMTWFKAPDASGDDPSITFGPVDGWNVRASAGATYELRVRAVAHNGKVSAWSRVAALQVSGDAIPPTPPSRPSVRAEGSVIWVEWDGKMDSGGQPPSDFFSIQIHEAKVPEGAPTADDGSIADSYLDTLPYTLVESTPLTDTGSAPVFDREYGVDYAYKLTATDFFGNQSEMSPPSGPVHTVPLVDDTFLQEQLEYARQESERERAELEKKLEEANAAITASNERLDGVVDSVTNAEEAAMESERNAAAAQAAADQASAAAGDAASKATAAQTVADQAKTAAGTADQAARAASGLAATKGEVIYQASAPTGSRAAAQNLWIRTTDNKPHTWNGTTWVAVTDKAATDAASAASAAQSAASKAEATANQAKADAAAAVQSAASAMTKAGQAQASADGKNTITRSVSPASQPGSAVGDTHFTMSSMGGGGVVTRQQRWDGNTWQDEALSHQVIASLDLGKATVGELDGGRIKAGTITSDRLSVGPSENSITDAGFTNLQISANRVTRSGGAWVRGLAAADTTNYYQRQSYTGLARWHFYPLPGTAFDMSGMIPTSGNTPWRFRADVNSDGGTAQFGVYYINRNGSTELVLVGEATVGGNARRTITADWTTPSTVMGMQPFVQFTNGDVARTSTVYGGAQARPKVGTVLIEDGAVTGDKVNAQSVAAATGKFLSLDVGQLTTTGTANINEAVVNNIWAKKIASKKIVASEVIIGQGGNLIPNGFGEMNDLTGFSQFNLQNDSAPLNSAIGATATFWTDKKSGVPSDDYTPVVAGSNYAWKISSRGKYTGQKFYFQVRWYDANNEPVASKPSDYLVTNQTVEVSSWSTFTGIVQAPTGAAYARFTFYCNHQNGTQNENQWHRIGGFDFRDAVAGRLIVDGSISTSHIDAKTFDVTKLLRANSIEAQYLKVDQIKDAVRVDSDIFNGRLYKGAIFQGGEFRTHDTRDKGIAIFSAGMRVTDPRSGKRTFDVNAGTGEVEITGTFTTGTSGNPSIRVVSSEASWNGTDQGVWFTYDGNPYGWGTTGSNFPVAGVFTTAKPGSWNMSPNIPLQLRGFANGGVKIWDSLQLQSYLGGSAAITSTNPILLATTGAFNLNARGNIRMETPGTTFLGTSGGGVVLGEGNGFGWSTGSAPNAYIHSNGRIFRNSSRSDLKLKQKLYDVPEGILDVPVKSWYDRLAVEMVEKYQDSPEMFPLTEENQLDYDGFEQMASRRMVGLIAEDVLASGAEALVTYDMDGSIQGFDYAKLAVFHQPFLRQLWEFKKKYGPMVEELETLLPKLRKLVQ